jgi:hypothetical protein
VEARLSVARGVQTQVLLEARRRCCVCFGLFADFGLKKGQISHIDGDRLNNRASNLAFLCLDHHDQLDSRTSQSKGLTPQEVRAFKQELAARVRALNAPAAATKSATAPQERIVDLLADNPAAAKLLAMLGEPVLPPRTDLSAFGRWRLRFTWEKNDRMRLGLFLPDLRLTVWTGGGVWNFYHTAENRVSERVFVETEDDCARKAEWLAAKDSVRVYPSESGRLSIWEYRFPDDTVEVSESVVLDGHRATATAGRFDVNSERLASADREGEVILWDWRNSAILGRVHSVVSRITRVSFYPDPSAQRLIVNNQEGEFEILDFETSTSIGGDG